MYSIRLIDSFNNIFWYFIACINKSLNILRIFSNKISDCNKNYNEYNISHTDFTQRIVHHAEEEKTMKWIYNYFNL